MRTLKIACSALLLTLLCGCESLYSFAFSAYPGGWESEPVPGEVVFPQATFQVGTGGEGIRIPLPESVDDRDAFIDSGRAVYEHFGMGVHDLGDGYTLQIVEAPRARQVCSVGIPLKRRMAGFWAYGCYMHETRTLIAPGQEGPPPLPRTSMRWNSNQVLGHELHHLLLHRQRPETLGKWHGLHWSQL